MASLKSLLLTLVLLTTTTTYHVVSCLDNGLALRPPMGWLSWARYICNIDCAHYPNDCISENLYYRMADHLVSGGYAAAGYNYINIDDCWAEKSRDPLTSQLVPDRQRFPGGIKKLADYVHAKGLKLGIYGDVGKLTCMGYPGSGSQSGSTTSQNYYMLDAQTFADWGVDSLKLDGCYADITAMDEMYPRMGHALNLTGREMLYSCSWPAYQVDEGMVPDYKSIARHCNLWRNFDDIEDSWKSVSGVIDFYGANSELFSPINGPGQWFDPDMLVIGNYGLSLDQARAQMALWSIWSAPLYMSTDLRTLRREFKEILLNKDVIAINQDPLGRMGTKKTYPKDKQIEIWTKPIHPLSDQDGTPSLAVVYLNRRTLGGPIIVEYPLSGLVIGANQNKMYQVQDLFEPSRTAMLSANESLTLVVNPAGGVRMVKVTAIELVPSAAAATYELQSNNL